MDQSATAVMLTKAIDQSPLTQREIAKKAGFPAANVISMIKKGEMKLPIDRIPALARALGIDPLALLTCAMEEYNPEVWHVIQSHKGEFVSEDELIFLRAYRAATLGRRLVISRTLQESLVEFFRALGRAYDAAQPPEEHETRHKR